MADLIRIDGLWSPGFDPGRVLRPDEGQYASDALERAQARSGSFRPLAVAERFEAFKWMGFKPHGLFLPHDEDLADEFKARLRVIGHITDVDQRLAAYHALQDDGEALYLQGVLGRWSGQQAWARSEALYRLVAVSRRGGKTRYAASEAIAMLKMRPRSRVWLCASTMGTVDRCFQMVKQLLLDLGVRITHQRDARDEKLLVVEGGSVIEGVSLDERAHEAGAGVDLAIIDEANEVTRDAWLHVVLPPLADRAGRALLISSYRGQENFFYEQAEDAAEAEDWEVFSDVSWDVNFYAFPQGRQTPTIQAAERASVHDPAAFLEEFANIPVGTRRAIYPQYRDEVHFGFYPYRPGIPVMLGLDPSSGANEYGLVAVQEYDRNWYAIDEFYRAAVMAEDVMAWADDREWRSDFEVGVCDSAMPTEIRRWRDNGWNIIAVEKPQVEERITVYRRLLRDPFRFYPTFKRLAAEILEERGDDRDYDLLSPYELALVHMEIEGKLAPGHMTPQTIEELQACARIFINRATCPNLAHEHKTYAYRKPPKSQNMVPEKPRKWKDHLVDALGYLAWMFKRYDVWENDRLLSYSYLRVAGRSDIDEIEDESPVDPKERQMLEAAEEIGAEIIEASPLHGWLTMQRAMNHRVGVSSERSSLILTRR